MLNMRGYILKFMTLKLLLLWLVLTVSIMAETNYEIISDIGSSARMLRLGNVEGFNNSSISLFENPGSLKSILDYSFDLFTTTFMGEVKYYAYSYAKKTKYGNVGIGFMSKGIDDVAHTFATDKKRYLPEYYYKYSNSIFSIGIQNNLEEWKQRFLKDNKKIYKVKRDSVIFTEPNKKSSATISKNAIVVLNEDVTPNAGYIPVYIGADRKVTRWVSAETVELQTNKNSSLLSEISAGISLKYFRHRNDTILGKSWNSDLGFTYSKDKVDYSLGIKNIFFFSKIKYNNGGKEKVPMHIAFAIKYPYEYADLFLQLKYLRNRFLWSFAASYSPNELPYIDLSIGYKPFFILNDVNYNFVLGFGVNVNDLSFNYAQEFSANEYFNNKHYFSISLNR